MGHETLRAVEQPVFRDIAVRSSSWDGSSAAMAGLYHSPSPQHWTTATGDTDRQSADLQPQVFGLDKISVEIGDAARLN